MIASLLFSRVYHAFPVMLSEIRLFAKKSPEIFMKCKHSAEKCGIIAAVCYKEKQRISRDKTHETDHTTQEDRRTKPWQRFMYFWQTDVKRLRH